MEVNNENQAKNVRNKTLFQKIKSEVFEFVKFAIIAVIIVLPIRMFIAQPFVVNGSSMFPTFHDGEYLIIDELSYNIGSPKRGDVVIFHPPLETKKYYIKRVIGMPGETLTIKNGKVTIKNQESPDGFELKEDYINEKFYTNGTYTMGEKEYFVMGDNRNYSSDSRVWGKVPEKLIVGRAFVRLLPIAHASFLPGKIK